MKEGFIIDTEKSNFDTNSTFFLRTFGVLDFEACNFVKQVKRYMLQAIDVVVIDGKKMDAEYYLDTLDFSVLNFIMEAINEAIKPLNFGI